MVHVTDELIVYLSYGWNFMANLNNLKQSFKGGLLIYCDLDSYPNVVPCDGKWKIAIGIHPKEVGSASKKQKEKFWEIVLNSRVSAVGKGGLDTSMKTGALRLSQKKAFLSEVSEVCSP